MKCSGIETYVRMMYNTHREKKICSVMFAPHY